MRFLCTQAVGKVACRSTSGWPVPSLLRVTCTNTCGQFCDPLQTLRQEDRDMHTHRAARVQQLHAMPAACLMCPGPYSRLCPTLLPSEGISDDTAASKGAWSCRQVGSPLHVRPLPAAHGCHQRCPRHSQSPGQRRLPLLGSRQARGLQAVDAVSVDMHDQPQCRSACTDTASPMTTPSIRTMLQPVVDIPVVTIQSAVGTV